MSERRTYTLDELETRQGYHRVVKNSLLADDPLDSVISSVERCIVANGCFDVLHPGHLSLLASLDTLAYQMKLRPIVAMNSDASVRRLKGDSRPVVPQEARALLVNSLKWPLTVVLFDEETPQRLMDFLRPAAVLKGSEYDKGSVIRWRDSQVVSVDMVPGWSTSRIVGDTR